MNNTHSLNTFRLNTFRTESGLTLGPAEKFGRTPKTLEAAQINQPQKPPETITPLAAQQKPEPKHLSRKKRWPWLLLLLSVGGCFGTEWNLQKTAAWLQSARFSESKENATNRRNALANALQDFVQEGPIDWPCFADCVELIAHQSPDDETFRRDVAYFFGEKAFFKKQLDKQNHGLKPEFYNTGYIAEQIHHYVGATTGETWWGILPTHLYNCPAGSYAYESYEYFGSKKPNHPFNQGDIRLFEAARQHRDDFLKHGRHTVAPNIRQLCQ